MTTIETASLERLRSSREISEVLRHGRRRAGRLLVVHARESGDRPARVAVTASRKVGTAVARNRTKRLLRAASRGVAWRDAVDVVLVARADCAAARAGDVSAELTLLGDELGVLRNAQ
ncbi:MAG: ribonuclease P protein component [Nitriliruptorales bacterium]